MPVGWKDGRMDNDFCDTCWGTHSCQFVRGHDGPCRCDCDDPADRDDGNVGGPPYYGQRTNFYGRDSDSTRERNLALI